MKTYQTRFRSAGGDVHQPVEVEADSVQVNETEGNVYVEMDDEDGELVALIPFDQIQSVVRR